MNADDDKYRPGEHLLNNETEVLNVFWLELDWISFKMYSTRRSPTFFVLSSIYLFNYLGSNC